MYDIKIDLDIGRKEPQLSRSVKISDTSRRLAVTLRKHGTPISLTLSQIAVITYLPPSGTPTVLDCTVDILNNCIWCDLLQPIISKLGVVKCELQLFDDVGNEIASPRFNIIVRDIVSDGSELVSQPEYSTLNNLVEDIKRKLANGEFNGKDAVGILDFSLTSSYGRIDTYTLTLTDSTTRTFTVTNGKDGYTPVKGVDYTDGKDGYTPQKNVDYFDGKDGEDGDDGVSVTHYWNGTTLFVTSASGTTYSDLKGTDGRTPVKGVDYFTDSDKTELVNAVLAMIPIYNGEVIAE